MKTNVFLLLLVGILLSSCVKDVTDLEEFNYLPEDYQTLTNTLDLPETPFDYTPNLPQYMQQTGLRPRVIGNNRATLGRVLFYDKSLSKTGDVSCASCHKQELAFADNAKFSKGINNQETARNSIALGSVVSFAAYYGGTDRFGFPFFWDERAPSASQQSLMSLTNSVEMGMSHTDILNAVKGKDYYEILFKTAYKDPEITVDKALLALEAFVDGIGSYESKLDQAAANEANRGFVDFNQDFSLLSASENRGKKIFVSNCGQACHGRESLQPGQPNANNGLDLQYADKGIGDRQEYKAMSQMKGRFKVPALRNVALTAPYMHDGRFASLSEVIDFYSTGINDHPNLDERLKENGAPKRFNFTDQDKQDLIAYLNTFTDTKILSDEKYSDPFK